MGLCPPQDSPGVLGSGHLPSSPPMPGKCRPWACPSRTPRSSSQNPPDPAPRTWGLACGSRDRAKTGLDTGAACTGAARGHAGHGGGWQPLVDQDGFQGCWAWALISLPAQLASWGVAAGRMGGTPSGADSSRLARIGWARAAGWPRMGDGWSGLYAAPETALLSLRVPACLRRLQGSCGWGRGPGR